MARVSADPALFSSIMNPSDHVSWPVGDVAGKSVVTIEGLAVNGKLHPVQKAFVDHDALQCGYLYSGHDYECHGTVN